MFFLHIFGNEKEVQSGCSEPLEFLCVPSWVFAAFEATAN
jgi:hypothetical protein